MGREETFWIGLDLFYQPHSSQSCFNEDKWRTLSSYFVDLLNQQTVFSMIGGGFTH